MKTIDQKRWKMLMKQCGLINQGYKTYGTKQLGPDIFLEVTYFKDTNRFGVDFLEGGYKSKGVLNYSSHFTPNLLPTAVKLAGEYVSGNSFQEMKKMEQATSARFSNFFENKTSIEYSDLVMY